MAKLSLGILVIVFLFSCKQESPAPLPTANFFVDNSGCTSPCYVKFYDQSYSATRWHWDFKNGVTSTKQHDSSSFNTPGFYNVTLQVWNADDVKDEITKQITVY